MKKIRKDESISAINEWMAKNWNEAAKDSISNIFFFLLARRIPANGKRKKTRKWSATLQFCVHVILLKFIEIEYAKNLIEHRARRIASSPRIVFSSQHCEISRYFEFSQAHLLHDKETTSFLFFLAERWKCFLSFSATSFVFTLLCAADFCVFIDFIPNSFQEMGDFNIQVTHNFGVDSEVTWQDIFIIPTEELQTENTYEVNINWVSSEYLRRHLSS